MLHARRNGHATIILCILGTIMLGVFLGVATAPTSLSYGLDQPGSSAHRPSASEPRPASPSGSHGAIQASEVTSRLAVPDTGAQSADVIYVVPTYIWSAARNYLGAVPMDGSISEWAPHYYVAHSWGPYGQMILGLSPGHTVLVNNEFVQIQGAVSAPKYTSYNTIMDYVGWDATVFQTCIPNTEDCLFVYARGATSTIGAANEARAFAGVALMTDAS